MNANSLTEILQQGFRVTLGATSTLVEMVQDSQKRSENIEKLQSEWSRLAEELAEKGEQTEREARKFVDGIIAQRTDSTGPGTTTSTPSSSITTTPVSVSQADSAQEVQELTEQIAALRKELETLRGPGSSN